MYINTCTNDHNTCNNNDNSHNNNTSNNIIDHINTRRNTCSYSH